MVVEARAGALDQEIAALSELETARAVARSRTARLWTAAWPGLLAATFAVALWQAVALSGWRPPFLLPGPGPVVARLGEDIVSGRLLAATTITLGRAGAAFLAAVVIGTALGLAVAHFRWLRAAVGSLIAGLQTMPSIAWFPLAILLFQLSEAAILFVVVLGAAPAIASGLISGVDHVPPVLLRAGRVLGARGLGALRHVVVPAALPGYLAGLKQGWAFAWRSLMAGELLVILPGRVSLGALLQFSREQADAVGLLAGMLVILVVGITVDSLVFGRLERTVRRRRGLVPDPMGGV